MRRRLALVLLLASAHAGARDPALHVRSSVVARCAPGDAADDCPRRIIADLHRADRARPQRLRGPFPERARDVPVAERVRIVDFDFDGHDDIALCTGREALGGAPSYTVFRDRPTRGRFVRDARLTALQARASGFFVVDTAHRRLRLDAHGGSGRRVDEYAWRGDRPIRMRSVAVDAAPGGRLHLVLGERVGGRWRERRWSVAEDAAVPPAFEVADRALRQGL